jgi:sulfatase modifying factor 1
MSTTDQSTGSQQEETLSSCCSPTAQRTTTVQPLDAEPSAKNVRAPQRAEIRLPGGEFLMGTDYSHAFRADGEGPVRPVTLSPFSMDTYPVTNRDFAAFVDATGYRTESELFAWSFVFWMHLPPERLEELVEDTVAAAPWWCKVPGASWKHPEGPGSHVRDRANHPVVHTPGMTLQPTPHGRVSRCPPKHSGSMRRAAGSNKNSTPGAMS